MMIKIARAIVTPLRNFRCRWCKKRKKNIPFLLGEDGRTFVSRDFLIVVDAYHQIIAQCFRLPQGICMTKVHHVITAIRNV